MINSIEEILEAAKRKEPFIILDDEKRENEGDLIILAEYTTPEIINFMITHCRGLVCLAIDNSIAQNLDLKLQSRRFVNSYDCASTVSIDARHNITTGTSVYDRTNTIKVAISPLSIPDDIKTPGHMFPVIADAKGVLNRAGHTEASVDIAKLCNLTPAAVICEILNENGSMARREDLITFSMKHNLKISTIARLIEYMNLIKKF